MRCTLMNVAVFLAMTLFMAVCFADGASVQPAAKISYAAYSGSVYGVYRKAHEG